jgi:hypothetical protein
MILSLLWLSAFVVIHFLDHWFLSTAYLKVHRKSSWQESSGAVRAGFHFNICWWLT